jgi:uroporphyrin-III C-methyltransferase
MERRGKVYLTGAGPGAADLLTLRAARVLGRADVVLHDSLVSAEVLQFCPPGCRIVPVGRRRGVPAADRQEAIHRLLDEAARDYPTVVRLKGGDPSVFGRGGEELEFLTARRIPWEVIPGISAGIGGLSALGLPLTHRQAASSVTLLTGSRAISGDFRGIPPVLSPDATLVFYMGFQHVAAIAEELLRHGLEPETFALCASRVTCPDQRLLAAPLGRIGAEVTAAALATPALLVVGDVVAFWHKLCGPGG